MAQVRLPNGELVNINERGDILNPDGSVFTGGGGSLPSNNDVGAGGRGESNLTPEQSSALSEATSQGLAMSEAGNYLSDPTFSFINKSGQRINSFANKGVNRPIRYSQNALGEANTASSGIDGENSRYSFDEQNGDQKSASDYLNEFKRPETREQILARKTEEAKNRIQAAKDYGDSIIAETTKTNELRNREANARAVLSGLSGSTEASNIAIEASTKNENALKRARAEKAIGLEEIYKSIVDETDREYLDAEKTATDKAQGIVNRSEQTTQKAINNISILSKSGIDFDKMKVSDPVTYQRLSQQVGGEGFLRAISVLNRPQEQIIDKKIESGKYVIAYQNPITGKTRIESVDLGIPPEYTKSVDLGDKIMFVPDNFNPAVDKPIYYNKGIAPKAFAPSKTTTLSTNKITLSEAKANGLPKYVVGMSEEEINQSLYDPNPPKWFRDKVSLETQQTPLPKNLQVLWETFRQQIINNVSNKTTPTGESKSEITNPF